MAELFEKLERVSGVKAPTRRIPGAALLLIAALAETQARLTGKPALLSIATVRIILPERERSRFDPAKSHAGLGLTFRPIEDTLADEITWFKANGFLSRAASDDRRIGTIRRPGRGDCWCGCQGRCALHRNPCRVLSSCRRTATF
jgi:hypothetical protein